MCELVSKLIEDELEVTLVEARQRQGQDQVSTREVDDLA
jgi:hypothetical protein